ncbi:MAG TPA: glycosyltransferase [Candidatus Acidoferrales bacterium]|nr:glycosyltransferase [Candidatus Acidoferrales bacterium]
MAEWADFSPLRVSSQHPRLALVCLHTSPTAALGQSANGGLNVYVREVCAGLSDRGVSTDVFTRGLEDGPIQVESIADHSRVIYLPAGRADLDKYSSLAEVPRFARQLQGFIDDAKPGYGAIYSHYWLSGAAVLELPQSPPIPWLHTAHTLGLVKNRHLAPATNPEPELRIEVERSIARRADSLVVSTASEGEDLVNEYGADPDRIAIVSPGVNLRTFAPLGRETALRRLGRSGQRIMLFVGRLERLKGVDIILRGFALAADRRHPSARLVILGEDSEPGSSSERARLMQVTRELGLEGRAEFLGPVDQSELAVWYAAAEACLIPSYSESFGLVGLEAQACGTPVIASNLAGFATVVRDGVTGYLVDGPDPAAYAQRIGRMLGDPELSTSMGRRGTMLAQCFSWSRTVDSLLDGLADLITTQEGVQASAATE